MQTFAQPKLHRLVNHPDFRWDTLQLNKQLILYIEQKSYAAENKDLLKEKVMHHYQETLAFMGVSEASLPIHYFVVESRQRMKRLIGYETNGNAHYKGRWVTGIFSPSLQSVRSNHELFHLLAMNKWGVPERWLNEGMAVYADGYWNGFPLHELAKYLLDRGKYVSPVMMTRGLRRQDPLFTYPLLGSLVKFMDETYGRQTTLVMWKTGTRNRKERMGKSLTEIEREWLEMLQKVTYGDMHYETN